MLRRAKVLSAFLAYGRSTITKASARALINAILPSYRFATKPLALLSGSFVVYAASNTHQTSTLSAKEINVLIQKADFLFNENKFEDVLKLLRPHKDSNKEEILWRISRAAYSLSKSKKNSKTEYTPLVEESYEMAKKTLEVNENSAPGHKWMSIALDTYSGLQGFRNRCLTLTPVKDHILRSFELDPSDATVMYIVGMWYYSIADLAWYERSILQAIAGKPPHATYEEALFYFKKAEDTSPNFYSLNLLMLGKCHLKLGDRDTAIAYLQRAVNYPNFTDDDHQAHQEASDLLKKLKVSKV